MHLLINEGILSKNDDSEITKPLQVKEIFNDVFVKSDSGEFSDLSLRSLFPNIRFSQLASLLNCHFWLANGDIIFEVYVERRGKKIVINSFSTHYIHESSWFYISNVDEALIQKLASLKILPNEKITLGQYMELSKVIRAYEIIPIVDEVIDNIQSRAITDKSLPLNVQANLYDYQKDGYFWMNYITSQGCGCVLGDEMGLGKTLQIIALIARKCENKPTKNLIIVPVSLLENWKREFERFAPMLKVFVHNGAKRTGRYIELLPYDVIVISYGTAISDMGILNMIHWDLIVVDEAQNIKNPDALRTKSIKRLVRTCSIAVTGTPFENHLSDIWSLIDFIAPNFLGSIGDFSKIITDDIIGAKRVEPLFSPLMIRRKVKDVAKDLPEKIVIPQALTMDTIEGDIYEQTRQKIIDDLGGKSAELASLIKLRMLCTHPLVLNEEYLSTDPYENCSKYQRFCEILTEIQDRNEKAILFTEFVKMHEIIFNDIPNRMTIPVFIINGSVDSGERQAIIDEFSSVVGPALLVANPRVAGAGLNITAANHVIHYSLSWNPAIEDQASARSYRRGQNSTVFIYRLFYANTVEEIVNEKIELKRTISEVAVVGTSGNIDNSKEILRALMISPRGKQ